MTTDSESEIPMQPATAAAMAFSDIMSDAAIFLLLESFSDKLPDGWGVELFYCDKELSFSIVDPNGEYVDMDDPLPTVNLFDAIISFVNERALEDKE
jgi:hypothetical protein